jgi:hypothetical protein
VPRNVPNPDTIEPLSPPETPAQPSPSEQPYQEPPEFQPLQPDFDQPDIGPAEVPELG